MSHETSNDFLHCVIQDKVIVEQRLAAADPRQGQSRNFLVARTQSHLVGCKIVRHDAYQDQEKDWPRMTQRGIAPTKSEYRNPKQIRMKNEEISKTRPLLFQQLLIREFEFVSDFPPRRTCRRYGEFRILNFPKYV